MFLFLAPFSFLFPYRARIEMAVEQHHDVAPELNHGLKESLEQACFQRVQFAAIEL
jgi:hypothetical protein